MAHTPVNHPLRPLYRALGALAGLYFVVFGVVGLFVTGSAGLFARDADRVFGQGSNLAWSLLSIVIGAAVLAATLLGRNRDVVVNTYLAWSLMVIGTLSLTVSRTEANVLNFTVSTVIVSYLGGLALLLAALYGKVAPQQDAGPPRQVRQRQATGEPAR